jgi:hypothetical protein
MTVADPAPDRTLIDASPARPWPAVRPDTVVAAACIAAAVVLRLVAVFRYQIDSDEPQHLHVVWAWANGLLPYRDVFDNHMPLFHMLLAPLFRVVGERPDALISMRLLMVPMYAAMIALTYRIAVRCYERSVAMWSTIVAALFPLFLLCSVEFRTDNLWAVFWLASIAVLVTAPLTTLRVALAGFLLGLAAAVSAKTVLLLLSVAVGAAVVAIVFGWRNSVRFSAVFLAACAIPPAAIALYFAARGAWHPFAYGVITHNMVQHVRSIRLILFPALLIWIGLLARRVADSPHKLFLFVTTHFYGAALYCIWPLVEHEHWLPYFPLAAITVLPMFFTVRRAVAIAVVEIALVIGVGHLNRDDTVEGLRVIAQTLELTTPAETVMDLKGETAFRQRAFFYVIEPMTKARMHRGQIADTIVDDVLRTHTMVVALDHHNFPRRARKFFARNFVSLGGVRVPGRILPAGVTTFRLDVPAEYAVVSRTGSVSVQLDGVLYDGPRFLAPGTHTISPSDGSLAILWSRAADRGFMPFDSARQCNPGCRRP